MTNLFYLDDDVNKCAKYYCNKHVVKIPLEIAQMLCSIHHEFKTNKNIPYKDFEGNKQNPYRWIKKSRNNYLWAVNLGFALVKEYEYRYENRVHAVKKTLVWLKNNIPNFQRIEKTRYKMSHYTDKYWTLSIDILLCNRIMYTELKCSKDKWKKRDKPIWFNNLEIILKNIRNKLRDKISVLNNKILNKYLLTKLELKNICLDTLMGKKWERIVNTSPRYDKYNKVEEQLSISQLFHIIDILTLLLKNDEEYIKFRNISLRNRNKLEFPQDIDYSKYPYMYVYRNNYKNYDKIKPYSKRIMNKNVNDIYELFKYYIKNRNFIGADVCRKYVHYMYNKTKNDKTKDIWKIIIDNLEYNKLKKEFINFNYYEYKSGFLDTEKFKNILKNYDS